MTTLEERLMQALHEALGLDDWGVANDDEREEMAVIARAVVAVLPTADVTNGELYDVVYRTTDPMVSVRRLLDVQAAAHAAEVEALREQIDRDRIRGAEAVLNEQLRTSTAEADRDGWKEAAETYKASRNASDQRAEALRAEVERLNRRLFPGQGQEYANEVERQRTVIDTLTTAVKHAEADRDRAVAEALEAVKHAEADRDRAVAEALEHAAQELERHGHRGGAPYVVRGLIPNGDEA